VIDDRDLFERAIRRFPPPERSFERLLTRRDRKRRNQRLAAGAVGLGIVLAAILVGTSVIRSGPDQVANPAPVIRNGPITVYGYTEGLYTLSPDGQLGERIVECRGCTLISGADWSPDGTSVAFAVACAGGCGTAGDPYHGVHVVDLATGEDRLVVHGEPRSGIDWSPDGLRIAYVEDGVIHTVNADGSDPTIVPGTGAAESPSWSPDGTRIAYSAYPRQAPAVEVYVADLDGSDRTLLARGSDPAWSPDGTVIAYRHGCEVRTVAPNGGSATTLIDLSTVLRKRQGCDPPLADFGYGGALVWSPDGRQLATIARGGAFLFQVDGGGLERLPKGDYAELAWQPILSSGSGP
jgi:Tol biopolymer transport system component